MEHLSFLTISLAAMVLVITTTLLGRRNQNRRNNYNLPPGPRPWPVNGNLNLGPLTHRSLHALSLRHGPLMTIHMGSVSVVVGSSADAARAILKTHDEALADRPMLSIGRHLFYRYSDMFWAPYGTYWRQARKLWHAELLGETQLRVHEHVRRQEVLALLRATAIASAAQRNVAFKHDLLMLNLNVVSRMVMGKKYVAEEGGGAGSVATPAEFRWMIDELFIVSGLLNLGDVIPWLNPLDLQGYVGRTKRLSRIFDRFLEHVLDEHMERRGREGDGFVPKDMTDLLLQLADDPSMEVPIQRDGVKAFILDTLAAGTDTSAVTIEWALSEFLKHPEVLAMATEELDRVVGRDRLPTEVDIPSLPFLQAVIKESMRLHPAVPLLSPWWCRQDVSLLGGYTIPAGTCVAVNAWAIGRDPAVWEAPDEFRPERFLGRGRTVDVKGQDFQLLPFGSGRRMCAGMGLGLKMVQLTLANLIHAFAWRLPDGMTVEELNMDEALRFTMPRRVPLEALPEPKLPAHLYSAEPAP